MLLHQINAPFGALASTTRIPALSSRVLDAPASAPARGSELCSGLVAFQACDQRVTRHSRLKAALTVQQVTQSDQIELPGSREAAVSQACKAALGHLHGSAASSTRKSFKGATLRRLSLELPVSDQTPEEAVQLAGDLYASVPADLKAGICLIGTSEVVQMAAKEVPGLTSVSFGARRAPQSARCLLIVGLRPQQVADAKRLLSNCRAEAAILVLASSDRQSETPASTFIQSFQLTYCFEPIAIKAFVLTTDGVVYKCGLDAPWFIMKRELLGKHKSIGRMSSRPQQSDLEAAFLNAAAVDSPVNRGIGAIKKFVTRQ